MSNITNVYLIQKEQSNVYKIGFSNKPKRRLAELQTANDEKLEIKKTVPVKNGFLVERLLHASFADSRKEGEWFVLSESEVNSFSDKAKKFDDNFELVKSHNTYYQERF
jgi:hypothetical protein